MSSDGATYCAVCHELIITREDGSWIHTTQYVHDHPAMDDAECCARCDHEYGDHNRRDGHCQQSADDLIGVPGICGCPRFVWSEDVFTVEVES